MENDAFWYPNFVPYNRKRLQNNLKANACFKKLLDKKGKEEGEEILMKNRNGSIVKIDIYRNQKKIIIFFLWNLSL